MAGLGGSVLRHAFCLLLLVESTTAFAVVPLLSRTMSPCCLLRSPRSRATHTSNHFHVSSSQAPCMVAGSTTQEDMTGKVVLVTGSNSGMGASTAAALLQRGAHVICVSRDESTTVAALDLYGAQVSCGDVQPCSFTCVTADLGSLESVRAAGSTLAGAYGLRSLDVVVANAGVMAPPFSRTVDGYESQMQINVLAQFLLLRLLADAECFKPLAATRIIQISSLSSERASFGSEGALLAAAKCEPEDYNGMTAYRLSKLAQVLLGPEIASRLNVQCYSVHPGVVNTPLFYRNMSPTLRPLVNAIAGVAAAFGAVRTADKGAETAIFLACGGVQDPSKTQGLYWADCEERTPNPEITNAGLRKGLWATASELVGLPP